MTMSRIRDYWTEARLILGTAMAWCWLALPPAGQSATYSYTVLNPVSYASEGNGLSGSQQAGWWTGIATGDQHHAVLWSGTPGSVVDLNPTGYTYSIAQSTSGGQQVGFGY